MVADALMPRLVAEAHSRGCAESLRRLWAPLGEISPEACRGGRIPKCNARAAESREDRTAGLGRRDGRRRELRSDKACAFSIESRRQWNAQRQVRAIMRFASPSLGTCRRQPGSGGREGEPDEPPETIADAALKHHRRPSAP